MSIPNPRSVTITITITGKTDRDPWEWGECIARSLRAEFAEGGSEFGPVDVQCVDVEDHRDRSA